MRTGLAGAAAAAAVAALVAAIGPYPRFLCGEFAVIVIAVISLHLLANVAGMLSLASAAFMGVGGYGVLILLTLYGLPLAVAAPVTVAAGWLVGWLIGLAAVRLSGISLAIVTFGLIQVFQVFAREGGAFSGDGYGLIAPAMTVPALGPLTTDRVAVACVFIAGLVVTLAATLTRSRIGRAWLAMKEAPVVAQMQGVNLLTMRARAFAVSGGIASLAGILQAILLGITNPNLYTVDVSISHVAMMAVGGASGDVAGAVLGPAVLFFLPEYLNLGSSREVLYGVALLLTLTLAPRGMAGAWQALLRHAVRLRSR